MELIHSRHMTTDQMKAVTPCDRVNQIFCPLMLAIKLFRLHRKKILNVIDMQIPMLLLKKKYQISNQFCITLRNLVSGNLFPLVGRNG